MVLVCELCGHRASDISECGTCHLNMCGGRIVGRHVLCMSKKRKRPHNPSPRKVRRRVATLESLCYIRLAGHNPNR